ncbi:MAG: helix-turn-helix transcriptional regulator [Rhodocyclaceae bacterium]|nr:helix-turn-helix transcriptional regulator [Rhodocyclaceae bacterium]
MTNETLGGGDDRCVKPSRDDYCTTKSISGFANLTAREQQVACAVAGGASNKEVARTLNITERTIKAHVSAIFQKLGARDRLHLSLIMNGHLT